MDAHFVHLRIDVIRMMKILLQYLPQVKTALLKLCPIFVQDDDNTDVAVNYQA